MRLVSILAPGVLPEICIEPLGSLRAPSSRASTRQPPAEPLEREPRAGHERTGAARVQPAIGRTSASLPSADREPDVPIAVTSAWGRRQPRSTSPHEQTAFTAYLMSMNFSAHRTLHSAASLFSAGLTVVPFSAIVVAAPITTVTAGMPMRMGGSHFDSTQWLRHFGTNCYHEHGSSGLLGTHNVTFAEHELTSDDDIFARCYEQFSTRCAAGARTSECGAIVVPASPHDRTRHKPSLRAHECWLHRGPLVLVNCRRDRRFTTYVAAGAADDPCGKAVGKGASLALASRGQPYRTSATTRLAASLTAPLPRLACNVSADRQRWPAEPASTSLSVASISRLGTPAALKDEVQVWASQPGRLHQHTAILHQSWRSCDLPERQAVWRERCDRILPAGWVLWLWTDDDNRNLIKDEFPGFLRIYDGMNTHIKRVDAVRGFRASFRDRTLSGGKHTHTYRP